MKAGSREDCMLHWLLMESENSNKTYIKLKIFVIES